MPQKPHFLCVLQTHSLSNSQQGYRRYTGSSKAEITKRCAASLVASMNYAQKTMPFCEFELMVLDDHSDEETLSYLRRALDRAVFKNSLESLPTRGIMPSILACYERGRDCGRDMVYFAQDDYLFTREAIWEMVQFYWYAGRSLGEIVSIYPFDDPSRYQPYNNFELVRIVHGHKRHWRTLYNCASCFMTHHSIILRHWDLFYKMGTSEVSTTMERDSINQLWQKFDYRLFCPIPSLALHMQYDSEKDPFIDWRKRWDEFAPSAQPAEYPLDPAKKILVNVGAGRTPLSIPLVTEGAWQEVRVDTDPDSSPDILRAMDSIPELPAQCADAVYGSHVLEHIAWHEIPGAIAELRRILKKDGVIVFAVPDLEEAAEKITEGKLTDVLYDSPAGPVAPIDMLYGHRASVEKGAAGMQHKTGFSAGVLEKLMRDLGFAFTRSRRGNLEIVVCASDAPIDPALLSKV